MQFPAQRGNPQILFEGGDNGAVATDHLLLEDGDDLLLEDGGLILLQ